MELSKRGKLSNGLPWEWNFGGYCELMDRRDRDKTLYITYLNTRYPELPWEDERFDESFSMSPALQEEWTNVCQKCYEAECEILHKIKMITKECADVCIEGLKANRPGEKLTENQYDDIIAACRDAVRGGLPVPPEDEFWMFGGCDSPTNATITEWVDYRLEIAGYDTDF